MEVILNQDVEKIGKAGAIVEVKDGFARNFLIPNGLAVQVTVQNLRKLEQERQRRLKGQEKNKKDAEELKTRLNNFSLTLSALIQDEDRLYGSITSLDVVNALKEEGFEVDKNAIILEQPIKALGIYEIPVKLHPEITAQIKVWVVKK